jgi:hypothetical protein
MFDTFKTIWNHKHTIWEDNMKPYKAMLNHTVDGCEILHHQKDGWNPINDGMFTTYQLVQDFATTHSILSTIDVCKYNTYISYPQENSTSIWYTQY